MSRCASLVVRSPGPDQIVSHFARGSSMYAVYDEGDQKREQEGLGSGRE